MVRALTGKAVVVAGAVDETRIMSTTCSVAGCATRPICRGWCSKHYSRWQRHGDPLIQRRASPMARGAKEKWCPACERTRDIGFFPLRGGRVYGWCRECDRKKMAEYAQAPGWTNRRRRASRKHSDSDRRRELHLKNRYGITLADYECFLAQQSGSCGICRAPEPGGNGGRWHVDHDHVTGKVRGLLCQRCNLGLGYFRDNPRFLIDACMWVGAVPSGPISFFTKDTAA